MYLMCLLLFSCFTVSLQRSAPEDDHYVAAVVEYQVSKNVTHNRQEYIRLIGEAAQQNADVVVFPELTLTNPQTSFSVPINGLLKEYPVPALHPEFYDNLLVSMSEAARNNQIYVVFNGRELVDCRANNTNEECPESKLYVFNTNVVMDRSGAVISRYRKINLFGEYSHTPALHPDLGVFRTDFGVTFGHFICFDLMFQVPAVQVVQRHQLSDVIFSTMWFSELPYLTAVEIQEAYAYSLNVNFLASGANNIKLGSAGSGIYSGKAGALVSIMPGVPTTRLLVSRVPKIPGQVRGPVPGPIFDNPSDSDNLRLIIDPTLPRHVSRLLVDGPQEFVLVEKEISCTFRVRLNYSDGDQSLRYRAFIQDGSNTYSRRELGIASCSIVACEDEDIRSCGYRFSNATKTVVEELVINMRTYTHQFNESLECDNVMYFPLSVQTNKFPLAHVNVTFIDSRPSGKNFEHAGIDALNYISRHDDGLLNDGEDLINLNSRIDDKLDVQREHVMFRINRRQDQLVAFGIWGRLFTRDVDHTKKITDKDVQDFDDILSVIYATESLE